MEHYNRNVKDIENKTISRVILQCPVTSYGNPLEEGFSLLFEDNTLMYVLAYSDEHTSISAGFEEFVLTYTLARDLIFTEFDIIMKACGKRMLSGQGIKMVYREAENGLFEARIESKDHEWCGKFTSDPDELIEQVRLLHNNHQQI